MRAMKRTSKFAKRGSFVLFEKLMQMNEEINELYEKETKGYTIALLGMSEKVQCLMV